MLEPVPLPRAAIVSLLLAAIWVALVPLTTGGPLPRPRVEAELAPRPIPLAPLAEPAVREEVADGGAGAILVLDEAVVRGVGGFSTNEVSDVLVKSVRCQ